MEIAFLIVGFILGLLIGAFCVALYASKVLNKLSEMVDEYQQMVLEMQSQILDEQITKLKQTLRRSYE